MSTVSSVENTTYSQSIKNQNKALLKTAVAVKVADKILDLSAAQDTSDFEIVHQEAFPINKKIIPLTKEKNILAKKRRVMTKIE